MERLGWPGSLARALSEGGEPLAALAATGLAELGLSVEPAQALARLARRVHEWARRVDLTAHPTPEAVLRRLVLDAAALAGVLPPARRLADLGSGAGFPGLPIALLEPERELLLVEARERAHHFQRAMVRELGLFNVRLLRGRAEALEPELQDAVVAQAMGPPAQVLVWMARWARPGGWLALPCADPPPETLSPPAGVEPAEVRPYRVPLGGPRRLLWLGRRSEGSAS